VVWLVVFFEVLAEVLEVREVAARSSNRILVFGKDREDLQDRVGETLFQPSSFDQRIILIFEL
jgi:hypothetical protein